MSNFIDTFYSINAQAKQIEEVVSTANTLILVPSNSDLNFGTAFFNKLYKALNIEADTEAQIVSYDSIKPINLVAIKETYNPNVLILAGLSLSDLDVQSNLKMHIPIHWHSIYVLLTDSPQALEQQPKQHKADFWQAFKSAYA